jgi:hypothetical protein
VQGITVDTNITANIRNNMQQQQHQPSVTRIIQHNPSPEHVQDGCNAKPHAVTTYNIKFQHKATPRTIIHPRKIDLAKLCSHNGTSTHTHTHMRQHYLAPHVHPLNTHSVYSMCLGFRRGPTRKPLLPLSCSPPSQRTCPIPHRHGFATCCMPLVRGAGDVHDGYGIKTDRSLDGPEP